MLKFSRACISFCKFEHEIQIILFYYIANKNLRGGLLIQNLHYLFKFETF